MIAALTAFLEGMATTLAFATAMFIVVDLVTAALAYPAHDGRLEATEGDR